MTVDSSWTDSFFAVFPPSGARSFRPFPAGLSFPPTEGRLFFCLAIGREPQGRPTIGAGPRYSGARSHRRGPWPSGRASTGGRLRHDHWSDKLKFP